MAFIENSDQEKRAEVMRDDERINNKTQLIREIYQQLTGKSESFSFRSQDDLTIDFNELRQINNKIIQVYSTHNVFSNSTHITVFHTKDKKEEFNSFENFGIHYPANSNPVLTIVMEYNFAIVGRGTNSLQQYKIFVKLNSRIAILSQLKDEAPFFMQGRALRLIYGNTAEIKIEYADYVVARTFVSALEEWVEGCKRGNDCSNTILFMQKYSHYFSPILSFLNGIIISLFFILEEKKIFKTNSPTLDYLEYGIIFFTSYMLTSKIASFFGRFLEACVDRYVPLSYLKINRGDERLIEKYENEKKKNLWKILSSIVLTIIFEVMVSKISNFIN